MLEPLIIYSANVCPFAQRTLILLKEKNIDYQLIEIDLDNKPSWEAQSKKHLTRPSFILIDMQNMQLAILRAKDTKKY